MQRAGVGAEGLHPAKTPGLPTTTAHDDPTQNGPQATATLILTMVLVVVAVVLAVGIGYLRSQEPDYPSASDRASAEASLAAKPSLSDALNVLRRTVDDAQSALEADLGVSFTAVPRPSQNALTSCSGDLCGAPRARVALDAERQRADISLTDAQWETAVSAVARALGPRAANDRGRTAFLAGFTVAGIGAVRLSRTTNFPATVQLAGMTECRLP